MDYVSTRDKSRKVSAAYAIANGSAPDGGLYCPTAFPAPVSYTHLDVYKRQMQHRRLR